MNSLNNTLNAKSGLSSLVAIVFCVVLSAGFLGLVLVPKSEYSSTEKRYLAQFPEASAENLFSGTFGTEFEDFLSDHFPARNFFVGCWSYLNLICGNTCLNGIYYGKDGYLIREPVAEKDSKLTNNIDTLLELVQVIDLPSVLIAVPTTGFIMEEELPTIHETYLDDMYFEQIYEKLETSTLEFIDLRGPFLANKDVQQLYYRTDHHWTTDATYLAYLELCDELKITPLAKDNFSITSIGNFKGTSLSASGFYLTKGDEIKIWTNETTDTALLQSVENGDVFSHVGLYVWENAEDDDTYTLFLDGNHSLQYVYNDEATSDQTLLLIQDSFAHSMTPFLAAHFKKIVIVDPRYYKLSVSELAKSEQVDQLLILYGLENLCTDTDIAWLS